MPLKKYLQHWKLPFRLSQTQKEYYCDPSKAYAKEHTVLQNRVHLFHLDVSITQIHFENEQCALCSKEREIDQ